MTSFSLTQLITGSSSNYDASNAPVQVFKFQASPTEKTAVLVSRIDTHGQFPLFSFTTSKSKPNIQLRRVGCGNSTVQPTLIGQAIFHSLSSKTDLTLNDQSIIMKPRDSSTGYKLEGHPMGKFKLDNGKLNGFMFIDEAGTQLARFKGKWSGGIEGATLELTLPCDDHFLGLIVLSIVCAVRKDSGDAETAGAVFDAVGSIAGAT